MTWDERDEPLVAAPVVVDGRERSPAPMCTGTECLRGGGGEVESRGCSKVCVDGRDVAAGLFWCAVSHVFSSCANNARET